MSDTTLTITIDSGAYVNANLALRVTREEMKAQFKTRDKNISAILVARQALGFSMRSCHLYSDYDPAIDDMLCSAEP